MEKNKDQKKEKKNNSFSFSQQFIINWQTTTEYVDYNGRKKKKKTVEKNCIKKFINQLVARWLPLRYPLLSKNCS